jgi:SAM-dependent methyltransferase
LTLYAPTRRQLFACVPGEPAISPAFAPSHTVCREQGEGCAESARSKREPVTLGVEAGRSRDHREDDLAMMDSSALYSLSNFRELIVGALELAGARRIVEIGSEHGTFTRELFDYVKRKDGKLVTIDPAPLSSASEFFARHREDSHFQFLQTTSLEAFAGLDEVDAFIVDGDHNYYTVKSELEAIFASQKKSGRPLLVFEHDVGWPSGRRDMYYAPERIPEHARRPYSHRGGVSFGKPGLVPGAFGDVPAVAFALEEGGKHNGVRTAIEDFLAEHPELRFEVVPAFFGLGVVYSRDASWAGRLNELLRPFADNLLLERMEQSRAMLLSAAFEAESSNGDTGTKAGFLVGPWLLEIFSIENRRSFDRVFSQRLSPQIREQESLIPEGYRQFVLPGTCVVCRAATALTSDYMFASPDPAGKTIPAWRERQICGCGLNCRQRSCYHVLTQLPGLTAQSAIYCTEQGALYDHIRAAFPRAKGSEYLGDRVPLGAVNDRGIRNEDVTRLTFPDASFECVFSLDVLEHVPDYPAAVREMGRVLKPGGWLLLTTPIHFNLDQSVVRASIKEDGDIEHHLPPVYHGDPIDPNGVLCFHDFGWDLLDTVRAAGFSDVEFTVFTAPHYGYVGLQYIVIAKRGPAA